MNPQPTNRSPRRFHPDVPKTVRDHLIGKEHSRRHKFIFGSAIMIIGVGIVKCSMMIEIAFVHFAADVVGYLLHGIGAIPIIKSFEGGKL